MKLTPDELKRIVAGAYHAASNEYVDTEAAVNTILARALSDISPSELRDTLEQIADYEHPPEDDD